MSLDNQGHVLTGVGNPDTTQSSINGGYNDGRAHLATFLRTKSSGSFSQYIDSALQGSKSGNTGTLNSPPHIAIGATQTLAAYYNGDVAEVLLYNRNLSSTEQQTVEGALADKYGMYNPNATWPSAYSSAVQSEITRNQWNKAQADAYVAFLATSPAVPPTGLVSWLRADAGVTSSGGNVSQWTDQSPAGNNAVQSTSGNQPSLVAGSLQGLPVIHFNGSNGYLALPACISNDFSMVVAFRSSTGEGAGGGWYNAGGIVDAEVAGVHNDFGLSLDNQGHVLTGVGNPDTTQSSITGGYNNGQAHVATFLRTQSSGSLSQYIDSALQEARPQYRHAQLAAAPHDWGDPNSRWLLWRRCRGGADL